MYYIYTYHILFVHSSVDGHLGCFLVLTAITIGLHDKGIKPVSLVLKGRLPLDHQRSPS